MKSFNDFKQQINEVLKKSDPIEKWISDFVHSTNPKFAGKSKAERMDMAKGAYYGAQKNEDAAASQNSTPVADMNEDQYTSEYKVKKFQGPDGEWHERKLRPHRVEFKNSKKHGEPAQDDDQGDYGMKESYDDQVDKKKVLNPPIPLTQKKKTVKDFLKKEEAELEEAKVYDPITKKMVASKPIKVKAGGGATRNGVPIETGPSKYKQGLKEEQIDEISKSTLMRYIPAASRAAAQHVYTGKEAQTWAGHAMRANDYASSEHQLAIHKKEMGKSIKRLKGIDTATKKLGTKKTFESVEESRGHKVLATFFKNREVAQRAFTGQNKPPVYSEKGIETPKPEKKEIKEGVVDHKSMAKHLMKMHDNKVTMNHIEDLIGDSDEPHKIDKDEVMNHVTDLRSKLKEEDPFPRDERWTDLKSKHIAKGAK